MHSNAPSFSKVLAPYQERCESLIAAHLTGLSVKNKLQEAYIYALTNGGKRFRPSLVMMIAAALGRGVDVSEAALAVEFFHTASLIADDLPCMDDDAERRNLPTLHKIYGEAIALLTSYALIAAGYEALAKNGALWAQFYSQNDSSDSNARILLALANSAHQTGILGATGGQFLDLFPPDIHLDTIREVMLKKTVSLFEISFVLGWIFGGGDLQKLALVKSAAAHFGIAFQIADDLGDMVQDASHQNIMNIGLLCGKDKAQQLFEEELAGFQSALKQLNLMTPDLEALSHWLIKQGLPT